MHAHSAGADLNPGIYNMSPGIAALAFIPSKGPFPAAYTHVD